MIVLEYNEIYSKNCIEKIIIIYFLFQKIYRELDVHV